MESSAFEVLCPSHNKPILEVCLREECKKKFRCRGCIKEDLICNHNEKGLISWSKFLSPDFGEVIQQREKAIKSLDAAISTIENEFHNFLQTIRTNLIKNLSFYEAECGADETSQKLTLAYEAQKEILLKSDSLNILKNADELHKTISKFYESSHTLSKMQNNLLKLNSQNFKEIIQGKYQEKHVEEKSKNEVIIDQSKEIPLDIVKKAIIEEKILAKADKDLINYIIEYFNNLDHEFLYKNAFYSKDTCTTLHEHNIKFDTSTIKTLVNELNPDESCNTTLVKFCDKMKNEGIDPNNVTFTMGKCITLNKPRVLILKRGFLRILIK